MVERVAVTAPEDIGTHSLTTMMREPTASETGELVHLGGASDPFITASLLPFRHAWNFSVELCDILSVQIRD